jgi:hypothetical protein
MTRVNLDEAPEEVRQFILALAGNPNGSVLELGGRAIALVVPAPSVPNGDGEPWTDAKNHRRCDLIDRKYSGALSPAEAAELARLQEEMLQHRQRVAPLPLEDARRMLHELLSTLE